MSNKEAEIHAFSHFLTSHIQGSVLPYSWAEMLTLTDPAGMVLPQHPEPSKASRATGTEWEEQNHMAH